MSNRLIPRRTLATATESLRGFRAVALQGARQVAQTIAGPADDAVLLPALGVSVWRSGRVHDALRGREFLIGDRLVKLAEACQGAAAAGTPLSFGEIRNIGEAATRNMDLLVEHRVLRAGHFAEVGASAVRGTELV